MNLGPTEVVLIIAIAAFTWGLVIWALVDILSRSADDFEACGRNRTTWIIVLVVAWLLCGLGWLVATFYLVSVRPQIQRLRPR